MLHQRGRPLAPHDRFEALALGRRVAAELAAAALDAASGLARADRAALARLSLAVTAALARVGQGVVTPDTAPPVAAGGPTRGNSDAFA